MITIKLLIDPVMCLYININVLLTHALNLRNKILFKLKKLISSIQHLPLGSPSESIDWFTNSLVRSFAGNIFDW